MEKKLELGQLVMCTVTKIIGTTVFVRIDDYNLDGSITFMEIAPGRIRNIRDYAFPGKKIVCKVMEIRPNYAELSFRRVKVNERNDFNEAYKKEKNYSAMLKTILAEEAESIIAKIKSKEASLFSFIESAKENIKLLENYISKEKAEKIAHIIKEKKAKETTISRKFALSSKASSGMVLVKNSLKEASKDIPNENLEISYLAAGRYIIKVKAKDPKTADQQIRKFMENLESLAKKNSCIFSEEK